MYSSGGFGSYGRESFPHEIPGGIDATALCIDSRDEKGNHRPEKIIDFVKMVEPSFGAVNLEDISQPNCYEVLGRFTRRMPYPGLAR